MKTNIKNLCLGLTAFCACALCAGGIYGLTDNNVAAWAASETNAVESFKVESVALRVPDETYGEGLRFKIVMSSEDYNVNGVQNKTTGILLLPTTLLGEAELTVDLQNQNVIKKEGVTWNEEDGRMVTYVHVYNIPAQYYATSVSIRAYVNDAEAVPVYSTVSSASVAYAADYAYNNDTTLTEEDKATLQTTYLTYDVNYHVDGAVSSTATGVYGKTIAAPVAPEKAGHIFEGWWNKDYTVEWNFSETTIKGTTTNLYAKWKEKIRIELSTNNLHKVYDGKAAALTVSATVEEGQISYQWYKKTDGQSSVLQGASSNTLNLKNVADSGLYYCTVSVGNDSINSATVSVTISKAPVTITAGSINKTTNVQFPLTCSDYELTSGKLSEGHKIIALEMTTDSALSEIGSKPNKINKNSIVIKDSDDNDVTSNYEITTVDGLLTITQGTVITTQPQGIEKTYDGNIHTLSVMVAADSGKQISYQWYRKNDAQSEAVAIQGATANTLGVVNVVDSGLYYCSVSDSEKTLQTDIVSVDINKIAITLTADSGEQTTDTATPLIVTTYKLTGTLANGQKISNDLKMTSDSQLSEVGTKPNKIDGATVKIVDGEGNDVTANYDIKLVNGTLTVKLGPFDLDGGDIDETL